MSLQFRFETDANKILPILEQRLPKSANIYNMCRVYDNFEKPSEMGFYIMNTAMSENDCDIFEENHAWVLASFYREDYGMRYALSAPPNVIITPEIKDAFVKCPYIDWNKHYHFACIDFEISPMIAEIGTQIVGNSTTSMPCKIFAMSRDAATNLNVTIPDTFSNELVFKPLDKVKGTEFICNTWKYSIPNQTNLAIEKLLTKNKSFGVYDRSRDVILCGMGINDCGLLAFLHCLPEHRGKGYATLVAKMLIKSFAKENGALPCSAVEMKNHKSIAFHEKLGMFVSHNADFIKYVPQQW